MAKKVLNQNTKYAQDFIQIIEPDYIFSNVPINRYKTENKNENKSKLEELNVLKNQINSIENCNLKNISNKIILGDGDINSPVMIIGEAPGKIESDLGNPFRGDIGDLLNKMLLAIKISRDKVYCTYSVNFRTPEDRKPTSQEIKRYSSYLKKHISIIDPKIIILMGATAIEATTGYSGAISNKRGEWYEIILKNKTYSAIATYSPSYLLRFPENKKYSWEDLKKIKKKIQNLNIKI